MVIALRLNCKVIVNQRSAPSEHFIASRIQREDLRNGCEGEWDGVGGGGGEENM